MRVAGVDERQLGQERTGADFLLFFYDGGGPGASWSVDSYLVTDADLPSVLQWTREHLPEGCCWALGVVRSPQPATTGSELEVAWLVGADVLNIDPTSRTPEEERLAQEMLSRRHRVELAPPS